nr:hypothetical protein [Tanacetum cinerariifolium]
RRDDDKLYKFKEGDLKRLRIQDIEDMLLLLIQGKLTNLTVEERFTFNKKLNLTKPDTYRSDLKRKEAYIAYSNPRGFIYQNKDKHNRLMRIDELHKFSDGTLTDVRTALDDRLNGIQMQYLPQTIWRRSDLKRLRIQDIEDMLLLMVQGKLSNLTVEERFVFNVSLRMFTRSIVIQRRVEDLQLGVESYQKRLNRTKPDTDGMLNDVCNALYDHLKGIQMQYLPTTIWRRGDKARAAAMIQAINKMLKTRRIMRSLERFVGGRQYEGDFRMLQRTI